MVSGIPKGILWLFRRKEYLNLSQSRSVLEYDYVPGYEVYIFHGIFIQKYRFNPYHNTKNLVIIMKVFPVMTSFGRTVT